MNFKSINAADFSGVSDITAGADETKTVEVYNMAGVKVAESTQGITPGIYLVREGSDVKKVIIK